MYQSSHRKNFLDILIDPTVIAILASIALHAIVGASLPFFTQPEKEDKKAEPGIVKVVELTPNELQRIPQAPPQAVVTPPVIPSTKPVTPPSNPPISPNSPTIPFSPIRIPLEKIKPQAAKGSKEQKPIGQPQPAAPIFDPNQSFKPARKKTKQQRKTSTVVKQVPIPKPIPKPIAKKPKVEPDPLEAAATDDDGGDFPPTSQTQSPRTTSGSAPNGQAQSPGASPTATNSTRPTGGQSGTQPSGTPGSDGNSFPPFYGKHAAAATERIQQYLKTYPDIKLYTPATLQQSYPVDAPCSKVKKAPFIVLMVAFDKVPEQKEDNLVGESTAPSIDKPYVAADQDTKENRLLSEIAVNTALYEANKADQNRPVADKGKKVLYQYRVQFDPTTCKR